jgi:8-oxo-dGTP diphosphatase
MQQIAQALIFDRDGKLLVYLRDDKPGIPFPNHWDFFGGHLEDGETPEQALEREVKEEIGVRLTGWNFFRRYECLAGDAYPNTKFIYYGRIETPPSELRLYEGQRLASIGLADRKCLRFANILGAILEDFIAAGLWPKAVDRLFASSALK